MKVSGVVTIETSFEVDVEAASADEAEKIAEKVMHERFVADYRLRSEAGAMVRTSDFYAQTLSTDFDFHPPEFITSGDEPTPEPEFVDAAA